MSMSLPLEETVSALAIESPLMSADQAASYLMLPKATLAYHRACGTGARFSRVGRYVRYTRADLDAYIAACRVNA